MIIHQYKRQHHGAKYRGAHQSGKGRGGDAVQGSWCQVQCCNFEETMKRMDVNQIREARGLQSDGPSFYQNLRGPRLIC